MKLGTALSNRMSSVPGVEVQTVAIGILDLLGRINTTAHFLILEHLVDLQWYLCRILFRPLQPQ